MYRIVETDNFGGDYPDEKFLPIPPIRNEVIANKIADLINECTSSTYSRYWKVVELPYTLQPGFEP